MNNISRDRQEIIKEVLNDLESLKSNPSLNQYAINENIVFFEAAKSISRYLWWPLTFN